MGGEPSSHEIRWEQMDAAQRDRRVRFAAFDWLADQVRIHGDVLPRNVLAEGLMVGDERVPLVGPQGIFKPRAIPEIPLSITSVPKGPYADRFGPDGTLRYKYRGTDPGHHDNAGLRRAMATRTPLVYFYRVVKGKYLAAWPVFIVGDDPKILTFTVTVDDAKYASTSVLEIADGIAEPATEARRAYITSIVRRRLHQTAFRERVLQAYKVQCALCRLRHQELLDAAHIIPDSEPEGDPVVSNGLALCKLHHAAYDKYFLAVRPDYVVEVREEILEEEDGPMLLHGLKGMNGQRILVPRNPSLRPNRGLLSQRYERFANR
jgi:putative restriction endonuclease